MDNTTLEQRTQQVLYLLSCKDPKYPKTDFFLNLLNLTKDCLAKKPSVPHEVTDERALRIIQDVARSFVLKLETDNRWPEFIGGWHQDDIFEALSSRVLSSIFTNKELHTQFMTHLQQSSIPTSPELLRYLQEFGQ